MPATSVTLTTHWMRAHGILRLYVADAHKEMVRGVRWLGTSARLVSFSSEKLGGGWRNTLLLTDVRNRLSFVFRDVGMESSPMLGIRASPTGRYLLVLLRGAPSEIWAVRALMYLSCHVL